MIDAYAPHLSVNCDYPRCENTTEIMMHGTATADAFVYVCFICVDGRTSSFALEKREAKRQLQQQDWAIPNPEDDAQEWDTYCPDHHIPDEPNE